MRKGLFYTSLLSVLLYSASSLAFLLPPFKTDAMVTAQEVYSYIKTSSQTASKAIQDNTYIQTTISYGKGNKEALDYKKIMKQYKSFDLGGMGQMVDNITKADAEKGKIAEEAATDITNKTNEANAKIAAIDENQVVLRQRLIDEPENAKKIRKEINKNEKEKAKIIKNLNKDTKSINKKASNSMGKLDKQIGDLKGKMNKMVSSIKVIPSNYDSSEDLNNTAKSIMPAEGTDVNIPIKMAYKKAYRLLHFGDWKNGVYRSAVLKSGIKNDDEEAQKTFEGLSTVESANAAITMDATLKAQNIKGLLDFIEILLRRLQVNISHSLATMDFKQINVAQATADFNFDNYRYNLPEESDYKMKDMKTEEQPRVEIPPSISEASEGLVSASLENGAPAEQSQESSNTGGQE